MRIRYMSDLHLELQGRHDFMPPPAPQDAESVLVLAGDIDEDKHAPLLARRVASRFRAVVQVCGNHEYYQGGSPVRLIDKLHDRTSDLPNVHLLENGIVDVGSVRFIGATLWTDFCQGDPAVMAEARTGMNDYRRIRTGPPRAPYANRFSPSDACRLHKHSRDYIREQVMSAQAAGLTAVVVTHHAPFVPAPHPAQPEVLRYAYGSDLAQLIEDTGPALWIFGHIHECVDFQQRRTRIVSNCRGYHGTELVDDFDVMRAVEV